VMVLTAVAFSSSVMNGQTVLNCSMPKPPVEMAVKVVGVGEAEVTLTVSHIGRGLEKMVTMVAGAAVAVAEAKRV